MLRLLTPAADRSLLTIEELRSAVGVTSTDQDVELQRLGLQVSDLIASACRVARAGAKPPTLRLETLVETIPATDLRPLKLSRRFCEVVSLDFGGIAIPFDGLAVDYSTGLIEDLPGSISGYGTLRFVYTAGFKEVPTDLAYAATLAVREFSAAADRDPLIRSETVEDVGRTDYQVGGTGREAGTALPPAAMAILGSYMSVFA